MMIIDILLFIAVILLTGIVYPVNGFRHSKKRRIEIGSSERARWYLASIISAWIPAIIVFVTVVANGHSPSELGLIKPVKISGNPAIFYIVLLIATLYVLYNICTIFLLKSNKEFREKQWANTPLLYRTMLPTSRKERMIWRMLAVTAGITEELIYRGYLFFALRLIFPTITAISLILISSLLFSLGHLYQREDFWKPATAGLFLSVTYYYTSSICIVVILHIVQDLVAGELSEVYNEDEQY